MFIVFPLVGFIFVLSISGIPQSWFTSALVFLTSLPVLALAVLTIRAAFRERAEQKAGYTTLQYGEKKLEQRDPYLGRVIRKAGEPYLPREDFIDILERAKNEAQTLNRPFADERS